jgi:hypothetical protein
MLRLVWDTELTSSQIAERTGMTKPGASQHLRINGGFFASLDWRNGNLVVKLPAELATALVSAGKAQPFAPNGRTFREWAGVPEAASENWSDLLEEALAFV